MRTPAKAGSSINQVAKALASVSALQAEQLDAAAEFEWHYRRSGLLIDEIFERQQRLRLFREALLNRGRGAAA